MAEPKSRRWELLALGAILLLALGLRLYRLDAQSLWNDEGTSVALAQRNLATITLNAAHDIHPPLYYYLLHFWVRLVGTSESGVRALSVLGGVLLVWATYRLGRRVFSPGVGLLAALLSALSAFQVYYSQEARMYILVSLCSLLSVWAGLHVLSEHLGPAPRKADGVALGAYVLASIAAIYSQYFAFAVLLAENIGFLVWLFGEVHPWPRNTRNVVRVTLLWSGIQAVILLAYVPWLWVAAGALRSWPAISARLSLPELLLDISRTFALGVSVDARLGTSLWAILLALLVLPGVLGRSGASAASKRIPFATLLLTLALCVPIAVMYALSLQRPFYKPKFMLLATPAYWLLLAQGVLLLGRWVGKLAGARPQMSRLLNLGVAGALVLGSGATSAYGLRALYHDARYFRDDYRGIVAYINATAGANDAIVINAPSQVETVDYYYHGPLAVYPLPEQRPINTAHAEGVLQRIVAQHPRVYAILWATGDSDPQRFIEGWLDQHCYKALDSWYGSVRLAVYAVPQAAATEIAHPTDYALVLPGADPSTPSIRLKGYTLLTPEARSGDILQLTLFWEVLRPIPGRFKVFTHIVDGNGKIVGQRDAEPGGGVRLTNTWQPGETIGDNYGVLIPAGTPPGAHILRVGLYGLDDGQRLTVTRGGVTIGDAIDLAQITIQ